MASCVFVCAGSVTEIYDLVRAAIVRPQTNTVVYGIAPRPWRNSLKVVFAEEDRVPSTPDPQKRKLIPKNRAVGDSSNPKELAAPTPKRCAGV